MSIPKISIENGQNIVDEEIKRIYQIVNYFFIDFCNFFQIDANKGKSYLEELTTNEEVQNYMIIRTVPSLCSEFFHEIKVPDGAIAAPGTILNSILLYVLARNFNVKNIFESGTASGFYASFLLLAAIKNNGHLDTVDILDGEKVGRNILYPDSKHISVHRGINSLDFLAEKEKNKEHYDLYSHDSLHTFPHMFRELNCFKLCSKNKFFVFFDDQRADNFWDKCISMNLFRKKGYNIKHTNAPEQLGGFLQYEKII